jgi:hypothetical protein
MSDFVKSATTSTPVAKSQGDIIGMLGRYGASGFGFRRTGDVIEVTFHMPSEGQRDHSVCIPVDVRTVRAKLDGPELQAARKSRRQATFTTDDQAERVAWRVMHLWIDAALSAVSLGAQTIQEAFFAHLVVTTEDGTQGRLVDYIATLGLANGSALPSANRLALSSGSAR